MIGTTRIEPAGPTTRLIAIETATPFQNGRCLYERRHMVARQAASEDGWILYSPDMGRDPEKGMDPDFGFANRRIIGRAKSEADLPAAAAACVGSVDAALKLML